MARVIGAVTFGSAAGLLLFLSSAYVVLMYVGHPTLLEEFP